MNDQHLIILQLFLTKNQVDIKSLVAILGAKCKPKQLASTSGARNHRILDQSLFEISRSFPSSNQQGYMIDGVGRNFKRMPHERVQITLA